MGRGNTVLLNVSGGEISPELYARLDLPIYQRGNQRVQNYVVLPQGGLQYRNSFSHTHNSRGLATGRVISFTFSEADTYVIEVTANKMRFYRNFGVILDPTVKTITAITKDATAVVTSAAHGFTNGTEIYISGIVGMKELNSQFFLVNNVTTNTFELQNIYGDNINSTQFNTYVSGGAANKIYELDTPYEAAHINDLHYKQSADTMYITHQKYPPIKLTRTGHTSWSLSVYDRTMDPFGMKTLTGITQANPGVFTTSGAHGFAVDDEVFIANVVGMTQVNWQRYLINTVPNTTTFTVKTLAGVPVNTAGFTAYGSNGRVIQTKNCPKTLAFLGSTRQVFGGWPANPSGLAFSRAPDASTGAVRFDDYTTGVDATHAVLATLAPVFDKQDSIQWINNTNKQVIVGCLSSIRRVHGDTIDDPISPSSFQAPPINNVGGASIQAFSNGQSIFYIDSTGRRVHSFLFAIQSNDFVTVNQNLASTQLSSSTFTAMAQQRGDSGLLWVLRADGVLLGLTFNELESIFGWHRHYMGGKSLVNLVEHPRAKVLSITIEPRSNEETVLWALVERKVGARTYRSVEYLNQPVRFVEVEDFFTESTQESQMNDLTKYNSATFEQLKDSIHVDSAISYDGSALSTTITMTPSGTTGNAITIVASAAYFDESMIGREIWKRYDVRGNGGGRAEIIGVLSSTQALVQVNSDFDNVNTIPAGAWFLTTEKVYGLLHLVGEEVTLQVDGAPGGMAIVQSDGSVNLPSNSSKAHVGFGYRGIATTLNLDVAGERGSAQAKIRKILEVLPRFRSTVGAKIGTTLWNASPLTFKTVDDITDRPTRLFDGIQNIKPTDSWTRNTKQVCLIQDIPSPQTLLSLDIMVETADD